MKDLTKYKFNDQFYGKGRLIQAILIDFISKRKNITLEQLQNIFPKSLNGKFQVIEDIKIIKRLGHSRTRYYSDSIIILKDGTKCSITSQWGSGNVYNIFVLLKKYYGYKFRKV